MGEDEQATALLARLPAAGMFEVFMEQRAATEQSRFGLEPDGTPAAAWDWSDLD